MFFAITHEPLALERLTADVERSSQAQGDGCGAVCSFVGLVRATHQGRRVRYLEYEAFAPLALKAFERIRDEIAAEWADVVIAIHHRVGRLHVGEASVIIVSGSAHRAQAFQACRYAIERIKQIAPIWKHEHFAGGDVWIEGATADAADETARTAALARACT